MTPTYRTTDARVLVERVGRETLVLDLDTDEIHRLAPPAALVWDACRDGADPAEAASAAGLDPGAVEQALAQLVSAGLLVGPTAPGLSRRQFAARVGAGVLGAALVTTLAVPTPAAAQSAGGGGGPIDPEPTTTTTTSTTTTTAATTGGPDPTPTILIDGTAIGYTGAEFAVRVTNVGDAATLDDPPLQLVLQPNPAGIFDLTFDPSTTLVALQPSGELLFTDNANWGSSVDTTSGTMTLTYTGPPLPAAASQTIGFRIAQDPGNFGDPIDLTAVVPSGAGGDVNGANNTASVAITAGD